MWCAFLLTYEDTPEADKEDSPILQSIVMSTTALQLIKQRWLFTNNCWIYSVHKQEVSGHGFVGFFKYVFKALKRWHLHILSGASEHELGICQCIIKYKRRKGYNNLF